MAQITRMMTDRGAGVKTLRLIESMEPTATAIAGSRPTPALPTRAALEMVKVGSAIAGFWLQQGTEQLALNSQVLMRTAAAWNWRERLELQSAFLRDGFARLNQGMSRYADEVHSIVSRSRDARADRSTAPAQSCPGVGRSPMRA